MTGRMNEQKGQTKNKSTNKWKNKDWTNKLEQTSERQLTNKRNENKSTNEWKWKYWANKMNDRWNQEKN